MCVCVCVCVFLYYNYCLLSYYILVSVWNPTRTHKHTRHTAFLCAGSVHLVKITHIPCAYVCVFVCVLHMLRAAVFSRVECGSMVLAVSR